MVTISPDSSQAYPAPAEIQRLAGIMPAVQQAQSETKTTWGARASLILLLLGLLDLFYLNFTSDTPIQQIARGALPEAAVAQQLEAGDAMCRAVASDGNLAMHFEGFDANRFRQGLLMSQLYFRAVYALYPKRVLVGRGDQVINFPADLSHADVLPDDQWLRQNNVRGVLILRLDSDGNVHADTRAIR